MNPTGLIVLSHSTYVGPSGATAAATYIFMTKGYKPPAQERYATFDVVKNQNGKFKWLYDNGPGFKRWASFVITCQDAFQSLIGVNAQTQYQRIIQMWDHPGLLILEGPDGVHNIHWATDPVEQNFIKFPNQVGDKIEMDVAVQFEEG